MKQNIQNGTICELHTDDKKRSKNLYDILKSAKILCKRRKRTKLPLLNFLVKRITKRKP